MMLSDVMAKILLVSRDRKIGSELAGEFERTGHELRWCPGPGAPVYVCAAGRGGRCALSRETDVVVLDGWLASDEVRQGLPSWHLLLYYRGLGIPVVFLEGPDGLPHHMLDRGVVALPRRSPPLAVAAAIESVLTCPAREDGAA
ncbi:MAG TPA: hypothetical protein VFA34_01625 [Actinomycetota bacterium]|jgi:hypothetical protein|nr:hypothetical protein [Actinomycetota bacterium]